MVLSVRALLALTSLILIPGVLLALLAGFGGRKADAQSPPVAASPNVELVTVRPGTVAISGVFSRTAPYFYVSGADSVTVFDVSDPRNPLPTGKLVNAVFENEAMTLGERIGADGKVKRFVLIGNDLANVTANPSELVHVGRIGGQELIIVDVTDPANPTIIGRTPSTGTAAATTSTHTVACVNASCSVVYSAGDDGKFSIFDLTDLTKPKQIATADSPAAGPNPVFTSGAGHHWNIDGAGIAWHTGSGGTTAFDISDPLHPRPITGTDENGVKTPYNDFIHHNSQRPNARAFRPGRAASVENGNVALVTEEDYVNDGDEIACDLAGTFQTWSVNALDGSRSMHPLDIINPPNEAGGGLSSPVGGFCSAHWFDFHQSGIVAQGYYQQGLRLIDVRNPRDLKQFGYFTGGGGEVWDAYWAPQRDPSGAVVPGKKTNLVYTVDAVRGVEVFAVNDLPPDLPVTGDEGSRGAFPADPAAAPGEPKGSKASRPCSPPGSRFTRGNRLTSRGIRLRGIALARGGCRVRRVEVAVARRTGKKCRFLRADGRFGARRSCSKPQFLRATGTTKWRFAISLRLPRGRYAVYSRAADTAGTVETWGRKRKILRARVR